MQTCQGRVSLWSSRFLTTSMQLRRDELLWGTQESTSTGQSGVDHSSLTIAYSSARPIRTTLNNIHLLQ